MSPASRATPGASRRRLAGLCLLPLLALAACSGSEDDPEPILSSDAASESPPPPSSDPTKQPWEKRTKAGAVAFVKHWVDVFNEAGKTGDTSELRAISARECTSCQQIAELIDRWESEGRQLKSKGWRLLAVQRVDSQQSQPFDVAVRIRRTPETLVSSDGKQEEFPGSEEAYSTQVLWKSGDWKMKTFDQITS